MAEDPKTIRDAVGPPVEEGERRPAKDTRCPTCDGSAHALAATVSAERGRSHEHRYTRKQLDRAWAESDRLVAELDSTYAHIRAVVENCKHSPVEAIRHQLVGLLPEVQTFEPGVAEQMRDRGLGHLVETQEERAREAWAKYGYGVEGEQ